MKKFLITSLSILSFTISLLNPIYLYAVGVDPEFEDGSSLVPCGRGTLGSDIKTQKEIIVIENPCNAEHLILMINKVIEFILIYLALPIATVIFMYAGFLLLFSGGDTHKRSEAKSMFWNVFIGLLFIAGSWLIVTTILTVLGYTGSTILGN